MCHTIDLKQTLELFNISKKEIHQLKQLIITQHREVIKEHRIGGNPNLAWCGDEKDKMLCLQSQEEKGRQKCTDTPINSYY